MAIDQRLLDVLQKAVYARRGEERRPVNNSRSAPTAVAPPKVAPRELQKMLRSGMTPQQVARATDLDAAYVEQFYAPVLYERQGIVRDAQSLFLEKSRLGSSGAPLGESVSQNLMQRRVRMTEDEFANAWTASRQGDHPWVVSIVFPFRGRARRASWRYNPRERTLTAVNKVAVDIGWIPNGGKRRVAARPSGLAGAAASRPARRKPARKKATGRKKSANRKKATGRKKSARKTTAGRKPAKKSSAGRKKSSSRKKPAGRKKPGRKKPGRKKTASRKRPASRKRRATRKPARKKTVARKKPARKAASRKKPAARKRAAPKRRRR